MILTVLYVIVATAASITFDELLPEIHPKQLSTIKLTTEIVVIFSGISLIYYFLRVQLKHVPSIFDGMYGFNHLLLREASGGIVFAYTMYCFQHRLRALMSEIGDRIIATINAIKQSLRESYASVTRRY